MQIDTSFDFRTDASGKDPDAYSATLCRYHKLLWSKKLPSGAFFNLEVSRLHGKYALRHSSELGEFCLTSDSITHTYTRWTSLKHITGLFSEEENEAFRTLSYTIGGMLVFPGNQVDGKQTINGARGCHWKIRDRFDITLECIRRHYLGQQSPLEDTLERYGDFFALFEDFTGYVEFFMLQDLVVDDFSAVMFLMPFDDFRTSPVPGNIDTYREYRRLTIEFLKARNRRIDPHTKQGPDKGRRRAVEDAIGTANAHEVRHSRVEAPKPEPQVDDELRFAIKPARPWLKPSKFLHMFLAWLKSFPFYKARNAKVCQQSEAPKLKPSKQQEVKQAEPMKAVSTQIVRYSRDAMTEEQALEATRKQFGPTARVWTVTHDNKSGKPYKSVRYRTGMLDDGSTDRFVEVINHERLRMKGVGGSWREAVASALAHTTPTSHL